MKSRFKKNNILLILLFIVFGYLSFYSNFNLIGVSFYIITSISFFYSMIAKKPNFFTEFIFVFAPLISIYKDFAFPYSFASYLLLANIFLYALIRPVILINAFKNKSLMILLLYISTFVFIGLIQGRELTIFIKYIETALSVFVFTAYFLNNKVNLYYYTIFLIIMFFSLFQFIDSRYEFEILDQAFKVNPSLLSVMMLVPLSYILSLRNNKLINFSSRYTNFILILLVSCLILTTSRTGIFVLLFLLVLMFFNDSIKRSSVYLLLTFCTLTFIYFFTNSTDVLDLWINKTFFNTKGFSGSSTGRFDQWLMSYNYFMETDLPSLLFGFSPGSGYDFTGQYNKTIPANYAMYGKQINLHSLYLNIFVEYGLIAFFFFVAFLMKAFKNIRSYRIKFNDNFISIIFTVFLILSLTGSSLGLINGFIFSLILTTFNVKKLYEENKK